MARRRKPPRSGALTELPPLKILSQIAILQAIYYVSGAILILFTALVAGRRFSIDMVFSWRTLRGDTTVGWMLGMVWMLNSFIGAICLLFLVSRSKLIPDFALTLHFLHLLTTSLYTRAIPTNALWWILNLCSAAFMTVLGVYSCRWRELRPITFGGPPADAAEVAKNETAAVLPRGGGGGGAPGEAVRAEELAMGSIRGSRRGRGRDGGGEYEMVGWQKKESDGGA